MHFHLPGIRGNSIVVSVLSFEDIVVYRTTQSHSNNPGPVHWLWGLLVLFTIYVFIFYDCLGGGGVLLLRKHV